MEEFVWQLFRRCRPSAHIVVLRLASVSGPRGRFGLNRYGLLSTIAGGFPFLICGRPDWGRQYLHEDDLIDVVSMLVHLPPTAGYQVFNVSPPDFLDVTSIGHLFNKRVVALRPLALRALFALLWHGTRGAIATPAGAWKFLSYPIRVDGSLLQRTHGYEYRYSSLEALQAREGRHAEPPQPSLHATLDDSVIIPVMLVGDPLQESPACDHRGSLSREWRRHVIRLALFGTRSLDLAERAAAAPSRARPPPAKVEALCARDFCPAIGATDSTAAHLFRRGRDRLSGPRLTLDGAGPRGDGPCFDLKYQQQAANLLPFGVYTIPECSMVGDTEDTARRKGIPYVVGRARYRDNARGGIIGDDTGFLKLIYCADEMRLIGAHMIGEQSIELINIGLLLIQMNGTQPFIDVCLTSRLAELYRTRDLRCHEARAAGPRAGLTDNQIHKPGSLPRG